MNHTQTKLITALREFCLLALLALTVPVVLITDVLVWSHGVNEGSLTEWLQEALVLLCALHFGINAWRYPRSRGFLTLLAGLFSCIFIRELDGFLDDAFFHGFWAVPAFLTGAGTITLAAAWRRTTILPLAEFIGSKSYVFMLFGFVILVVFSRSFGSGLLWDQIVGSEYRRLFKAAFQEGLELLGYLFIFYGTCLFVPPQNDDHSAKNTLPRA